MPFTIQRKKIDDDDNDDDAFHENDAEAGLDYLVFSTEFQKIFYSIAQPTWNFFFRFRISQVKLQANLCF